ncbi:MAG TPA: hypothetical protein VKV27_13115 [Solirubrobacteraceae bacterium]|nr:hypothetical protein [Solirubrobacteraceae bacterium]
MTSIRRQALKIDDPLGPGATPAAEAPSAAPVKTTRRKAAPASTRRPGGDAKRARSQTEAAPCDGVWRQWSGLTGVGSFRLPHELLAELSDTARELGLPVGLMATAAIAQLLDQPAEEIAALVDRADDARIHGRRSSRRPLTTKASR